MYLVMSLWSFQRDKKDITHLQDYQKLVETQNSGLQLAIRVRVIPN